MMFGAWVAKLIVKLTVKLTFRPAVLCVSYERFVWNGCQIDAHDILSFRILCPVSGSALVLLYSLSTSYYSH